MNVKTHLPIVISGAGIAGLSAGLALAHKGFSVKIFERAIKLEEAGAGIQLAPNATRILAHWAVLEACRNHGVEPDALELNDGTSTKRLLLHVDLKDIAQKRWHAPYITIHRADLQQILLDAVNKHPRIDLQLGHSVEAQHTMKGSARVTVAHDGYHETIETPLLIGCDGVWSRLRATTPQPDKATFSGYIAWRATIDKQQIPTELADAITTNKKIAAFMGPKNHLVVYPMKAEGRYNIVAVTVGKTTEKTWSTAGQNSELIKRFHHWSPSLIALLRATEHWTYWPLFKMKPIKFVQNNHVIFLGDAAHSLLPFAAQGSAMAIEDAAALAEALAHHHDDWTKALKLFNDHRLKRVNAVSRRGDFNGFVYHARGPIAVARNLALQLLPSTRFMANLDWLYGYNAMDLDKH